MKDVYESPLAETTAEIESKAGCVINCNWGFGIGAAIIALPAPGPT